MDLESLFYIVGIVFMLMMIGLLLAIAYFLTKVQTSIQSMRENIINKTKVISSSMITSFILSRVKNMFKKKRSED